MHWFTDVLVGAAVGTAVGAGLPWLLHRSGSGALGAGVSTSPTTVAIMIPF
jgi:membrane-associated phospholipid phosphatase